MLGHAGCGAISSALTAKYQGARLRSRIEKLLEGVTPGLPEFAPGLTDAERLSQAVESIVRRTVKAVLKSREGKACRVEGKMKIVGAAYDIGTGKSNGCPTHERPWPPCRFRDPRLSPS